MPKSIATTATYEVFGEYNNSRELMDRWTDDIKQLLDEVEHDIMNYQNRGLCYQIIQTRGFDNS